MAENLQRHFGASNERATDGDSTGRHRALHVMLPEEALVQLKIVAAISRMPIKGFLARLLLSATPFVENLKATPANDAPHS